MDFQNSIGIETFQLVISILFYFFFRSHNPALSNKEISICIKKSNVSAVELKGMRSPLRQVVFEVKCKEWGRDHTVPPEHLPKPLEKEQDQHFLSVIGNS